MEKESQIQNAICEYLSYKNYFFWRQNTAPTFDWKTNSFRAMPKYSLKGVPDIFIFHNGKTILLEVKTAKGKLSEHQLDFQRRCLKEKIEYHVVRSLDNVTSFL